MEDSMNISGMLARNARNNPNGIALVDRTPSVGLRKEITWKRFDERVDRLAHALSERGVQKGDRVLHLMKNSISWLEAYMAIVRIGAWAVPLNFRFSGEEIKYCAEVAEPRAMFLDPEFMDRIELARQRCALRNLIVAGDEGFPETERFEEVIAASPQTAVEVEISDEDPCSLYFTSGTTGSPKPILLSHKNLECSAITEVVNTQRTPHDVFVVLKPLYHTGDKIHWLASLVTGAKAVIQREQITPWAIFEAMHEEKGTVAMLLVPWLQDVLTAVESGALSTKDFDHSSWRLVLLGAQPVPPILVQKWKALFPHMTYEINYGLTEAAGPGCIHLGIGNDHKLGALGIAGFNWEARLVDEEGRDVPRGEPGEIVVKGDGVMMMYYKNPEKTAKTIRGGWLYTGDLGWLDDDGFIWPCDRKKDIIIYGGENVFPSEVEEAIQAHPSVQDVGVIGIPDERLGEIVAAVINLKSGTPDSMKEEICSYCNSKLPTFKAPKRIVFGKVIRNPTGKIEKGKMREIYFTSNTVM